MLEQASELQPVRGGPFAVSDLHQMVHRSRRLRSTEYGGLSRLLRSVRAQRENDHIMRLVKYTKRYRLKYMSVEDCEPLQRWLRSSRELGAEPSGYTIRCDSAVGETSMDTYEVYALRVGADPGRTIGQNFFFDAYPADPSTPMPQDYYFWVIRNARACIVVDTCFSSSGASARKRQLFRSPEGLLGDLGIEPANVSDLIMTHLHWDHAGNLGLFSSAKIHLQQEEMRFCTGPGMSHTAVNKIYDPQDVKAAIDFLFSGQLQLYDGCREIAPGIVTYKVGGHTPGSQVVQVSTQRGKIVLASDAVHFWANIRRKSPFPILESFPQALTAFSEIQQLAEKIEDRIIPGHDPQLADIFPMWNDNKHIICLHEEPIKRAWT
jgi:glyoxylase-like metal-dependent hydrolase (beta-lactamase superfamily II)